MSAGRSPLDLITIATPCTVPWDSMKGDDRARFCGACRLHVFDVSGLTRAEAEELTLRAEGRVCVRLHRRPDGRIVTKDCGRVRLAIERRLRWMRVAAAAILGAIGLTGCERTSVTTGALMAPPPPKPTDAPPPAPQPRPDSR